MMCTWLRLAGFVKDADAIRARWRDVVGSIGGMPDEMYRYMVPEGPLRYAVRIVYDSLGETDMVMCDPGSLGREGWRMRTLLNDAWDVFWRSRDGEFQRWEAAEMGRLEGTGAYL